MPVNKIVTRDLDNYDDMQADNDTIIALLLAISDQYPQTIAQANDISSCSTVWSWDTYADAKQAVLHSVNRCKSRYCGICRKVGATKRLHNLTPKLSGSLQYIHLTLTVPNPRLGLLDTALDVLGKAVTALYSNISANANKQRKYNAPGGEALPLAVGAYRSLEVTYSSTREDWHPHVHVLLAYPKTAYLDLHHRHHTGIRDTQRGGELMLSNYELAMGNLWRAIIDDIAPVNMLHTTYANGYIVRADRIKAYNQLREVCAYPTKGSNFADMSKDVFAEYYGAFYRRRATQSYGCLYGQVDADIEPKPTEIEPPPGECIRRELSRQDMRDMIDDGWTLITYLPGYDRPKQVRLRIGLEEIEAPPPPLPPPLVMSIQLNMAFEL